MSGALSAEDRARCERYFLAAPQRREKLDFASSLSRVARDPGGRRRRGAPRARSEGRRAGPARRPSAPAYLRAAALAAVAVGVGFGVWYLLAGRPDEERSLAALREAYRNERLIEARATGLPHAPLSVTRGQDKRNVDEAAHKRAELRALEDLKRRPGAESEHALGRVYLADGRLGAAVEHLEAALRQEPGGAQIQSDMGAALLERGRRELEDGESGSALASLSQALKHIDGALRADPGLPEALYNRALCLQYMNAPEEAREAWQKYLSRDGDSRWADEARRNLQSLSSRGLSAPSPSELLESFMAAYRARDDDRAWEIISRNREAVTGRMIAPQLERGYVTSRLKGHHESAQESLRAFVYAGELERRRGGDPYTHELARYYGSASPARLRQSADALGNMDEGYRLFMDEDAGAALGNFERARGLFAAAGNAQGAALADYWISCCYTRRDRVSDSVALLEKVARFCRGRDYKWLLAQAYGWLGTNHAALSEHSAAIRYDGESLRLAESISDTYQVQKASSELGMIYATLRQPGLSLENHYRGLSLAARYNGAPRQTYRNFLYTTIALSDFKYYEAAAAFARETLRVGETEFKRPSLSYVLHLRLGQIYSRLGRLDEAVEQADLGLRVARSVPDPEAGRQYAAASYLRLADIWREAGDCGRAAGYYERSLELYAGKQFDFYRYGAHKGRLLCALASGDGEAVRRDLPTVIGLYEHKRSQISEPQYRHSFFDAEHEIYDLAVGYEHRNGDAARALAYAESGRSRTLLDALNSGGPAANGAAAPGAAPVRVLPARVSEPLTPEGVRRGLPAEVQVVMYAVLPDRLLYWVIAGDHFSAHEEPVAAADLEADVLSYRELLRRGDDDSLRAAQELSAGLYRILLGQAAAHLDAGKRLCIIPDKSLNYLPFAALYSRESGRYVVEDWAVFYSPSLNVLRRCSEMAREKARGGRELLLSVGNPTFNRRAYPNLQPLQSAEREARGVAELFESPEPVRLFGRDAGKEQVLRAMRSADVIHFAGHYVIEENPLRSKMLLAARGAREAVEDDSVLYAGEILRHRFERAKLVVASACQTAVDRYYKGEGAVSLARAFIEAKIPLAVASQWPVDSGATAELMLGFHRHRQSGAATAEALRRAQVEMLRGQDRAYRSPRYWAAFLCVGGHAEY